MPHDNCLRAYGHEGPCITPTIHDLFNELHRRLSDETDPNDELAMIVVNKVDNLHHNYTDWLEVPRMEDPSDRQPPSNVVNRGSW